MLKNKSASLLRIIPYLSLLLALLSFQISCDSSQSFTVTPSGVHASFSPDGPQEVFNAHAQSFTVTADAGYTLLSAVEGTCPAGSWDGAVYTTGVITADCTVVFSASSNAVTVTPSGENVAIDPAEPQTVAYNAGSSFTVAADSGYTLSNVVEGTCPAGTWSGAIYTTGAITEDCTVTFSASQGAHTLGGTVSGLTGSGLILQNNGGDDLSISGDGSFAFSTPVAEGASYDVTVQTQPSGQACSVTNGSGTMGGGDVADVSVICADDTTTLSLSLSELALSVSGLTEYGVSGTPSSGLARTLTVTNTGSTDAANFSISYPTWPSGTTASSTCGGILSSGASCSITITPGSTASFDGASACTAGTAPLPGSISISADNSNSVSADVYVLGYGCIYQGGYIYAFDDTTAGTASVGGKVAATSNQSNAILWSSNSSGTFDGGVAIFGISEVSTASSPDPSSGQESGQTACNGATDGSCNTNNINVYYQNNATGAPINNSFYAAGLCAATISGFSDWYLPSICELGYDNTGSGSGCGSSGAPALQNMQLSLVDLNPLNILSGAYWSSTEYSSNATGSSWRQSFDTGGNSAQVANLKSNSFHTRCSREF